MGETFAPTFQTALWVPRPKAVRAIQITKDNGPWVATWVNGTYQEDSYLERAAVRFCDWTGKMRWVDIGWWVFELTNGLGFDAKSNDWFLDTYQPEPMCGDCDTPIRTHEVLCD